MQSHYTIPTINQHPRQESNLICDLRKVACEPAHSEDVHVPFQWTYRDSNPNCTVRRTGMLPLEHRAIRQPVPRPGVEPGPGPSERRMMSVSPPGQQEPVTREGLEPSRRGGHGLLRTACLPFHHLAILRTVDRGGSRTLICRVQTGRLPVRRHAHFLRTSGRGGDRTHSCDARRF